MPVFVGPEIQQLTAAVLLYKNWAPFRNLVNFIPEWFLGTKQVDPQNKGFDARKAFAPGVIPRAEPVQRGWKGWLEDAKKAWDKFVGSFSPETKKALADLQEHWQKFADWFDKNIWAWWKQNWPAIWKAIQDGMSEIREFYLNILKGAFETTIKLKE